MRTLLKAACAIGLALVVAAPVAAAPRVVSVGGEAGWVGTGIYVEGGDVLQVKTLGFVTTAKIPQFFAPGEFISGSGPAGQTTGALCGDVEPFVIDFTGPCAVDDSYFGELLGRVGGAAFDENTFAIGDTEWIVIPNGMSGELELTVSDFEFTYDDNNGPYTVIFG